jgi:hypothetical protein
MGFESALAVTDIACGNDVALMSPKLLTHSIDNQLSPIEREPPAMMISCSHVRGFLSIISGAQPILEEFTLAHISIASLCSEEAIT